MEPGDRAQPGRRGRWVLLLRRPDRRLRAHQPERHRLHGLRRRPDPADRRAGRCRPGGHHRAVLPRRGAGLTRSLPGHRGRGDHRARGDHPDRAVADHLSAHHRGRRPLQGGRRDQPHRVVAGARRRDRRAHREGHGRSVLRHRHQLHALLRGEVRSALRRARELGGIGGHRRLDQLHRQRLRRVGELRHHLGPGRPHEGGCLLRGHRRRAWQSRCRGSRVVPPPGRGKRGTSGGTLSSPGSGSAAGRLRRSGPSTPRSTTRSSSRA